MQIKFGSVMVDDQQKALDFYTDKLGFEKVADVSAGGYRWLTVSAPDGVKGMELLLEPMGFPPARAYQKALYEAGIPAAVFVTNEIEAEAQRLKSRGVTFRKDPQNMGPAIVAIFEDTCGNLIQLAQLLQA